MRFGVEFRYPLMTTPGAANDAEGDPRGSLGHGE